MHDTIFDHFKCIYRGFNGAMIATDDKLHTVYCTGDAYKLFGMSRHLLTDLAAVIPQSYMPLIKRELLYTSGGTACISFAHGDSTVRCLALPYSLHGKCYFIFFFLKLAERFNPRDIDRWYDFTMPRLIKATAHIASLATNIRQTSTYESSMILNCIRRVRKAVLRLPILLKRGFTPQDARYIDLKEYILRITHLITDHLTRDKIGFELSAVSGRFISKVAYRHIDMIFCNIISYFSRHVKDTINVTASLLESGENNIIMLSVADAVLSQSDRELDAFELSILSMISSYCGASIDITEPRDGKMTATISIPKTHDVEYVLFSPPISDDDELSLIRVELSDILVNFI